MRIDLGRCGETERKTVRLDPRILLADRAFPCPIYKMDQVTFDLEYLSPESLLRCVETLPHGYYVMFAVAADRYIECYPGNGPMGLIHAIVLHVGTAAAEGDGVRTAPRADIFHASTVAGRVLCVDLETYVERQRRIHLGYALYELDPLWDFRRPAPLDEEARALLRLEAQIPEKRSDWGFAAPGGTGQPR